nr:hypothetical protein [Streptomyces adustus]
MFWSNINPYGTFRLDMDTVRVVSDQAEAERIGFTGSPTIWIGGRDPFAEAGRAPGLACRVYRTPDGLAGAPELDELRQALRVGASRG